jgi:hypothetical protein
VKSGCCCAGSDTVDAGSTQMNAAESTAIVFDTVSSNPVLAY